jgi:hypothetical protein
MSFSQLYSELKGRYRTAVAKKYALSPDELIGIYTEGQKEGWSKR